LQIGESKYGEPILDRIMSVTANLDTAASCALVPMDSTMRSNLSVGPPMEITIYEKDSFSLARYYRFEEHSQYLRLLSKSWGAALKQAFKTLPPIAWGPNWDAESSQDESS
jgi:putative proteasome-type protease